MTSNPLRLLWGRLEPGCCSRSCCSLLRWPVWLLPYAGAAPRRRAGSSAAAYFLLAGCPVRRSASIACRRGLRRRRESRQLPRRTAAVCGAAAAFRLRDQEGGLADAAGRPAAGALGHHFVERVNRHEGASDARRILRGVGQGHSVAFFPEGTFTATTGLARFHTGAFATAVRAGVPVAPVVIRGTRRALRAGPGCRAGPASRSRRSIRCRHHQAMTLPPMRDLRARIAAAVLDGAAALSAGAPAVGSYMLRRYWPPTA